MEISIASMATLSSHSHKLWDSNPTKNELQRPLKIHIPLIHSHALRSSQFYSTYNSISKPIARHSFPKIKRTPLMAESGAYLAGPLDDEDEDEGNLSDKARELQSTLRLVECAMFSAIAGLAYFLSNLLRIENYFGCFFPLPLVISSMRWGISAGRKTMVCFINLCSCWGMTQKISIYNNAAADFIWSIEGSFLFAYAWICWSCYGYSMEVGDKLVPFNHYLHTGDVFPVSAFCDYARSLGALGFVLLSSWLLRENIFALIMINAHASVSYMLAAVGINVVPSMELIYAIFASLLLLNCGSFVFLLHVLYAIFLKRLGIKTSMSLPRWLERAI